MNDTAFKFARWAAFLSDTRRRKQSAIDLEIANLENSISNYIPAALNEMCQRESEDAALHASIRSLKSRHNDLSPVSLIPPDLLVVIFMGLILDNPVPDSKIALKLSQVCRYWREVTIDSPLLWTHLNLYQGLHPDVSRRSKDAPISLYLEPDFSGDLGSINSFGVYEDYSLSKLTRQFLIANSHRIRQLDFTAPSSVLQITVDALAKSASLLQSISVHLWSRERDTHKLLPLMSKLFNSPLPSLSSLTLTELPVDWGWPVFSQLRRLYIGHVREFQGPGLLAALERMSSLEVLIIHSSLPEYSEAPISSTKINLPHLRELQVFDRLQRCSRFINCLVIPPTTEVVVDICFTYQDRMAEMTRSVPTTSSISFFNEDLVVAWNSEWSMKFITPCRRITILASSGDQVWSFKIGLSAFTFPSKLECLTLMMTTNFTFYKMDWIILMSELTNLRVLFMALNQSGKELLDALGSSVATNRRPASRDNAILLPKVQKLVIRVEESTDPKPAHFAVIRDFLLRRKKLGYKISEFLVVGCIEWLKLEQLKELELLVDSVHCKNE